MGVDLLLRFKKIILPLYGIIVYPISKFLLRYNILDSQSTILKIKKERLSISRFGDGEYEILRGKGNGFQKVDENLVLGLKEIMI